MTEKVIEIPAIQFGELEVTIEGVSPLLTNRFSEQSQEGIESKQQGKASNKKPPRTPEVEFGAALHSMNGGGPPYGFPGGGIKLALVAAGGRLTTEKMTELRSVFQIPGNLLEIESPNEPSMRRDPVRLKGRNGTWTIAYRPMFYPWQIAVPVIYNANVITSAQILNLFNLAGLSIGIGCWRPENNGTMGQFKIKGVHERDY